MSRRGDGPHGDTTPARRRREALSPEAAIIVEGAEESAAFFNGTLESLGHELALAVDAADRRAPGSPEALAFLAQVVAEQLLASPLRRRLPFDCDCGSDFPAAGIPAHDCSQGRAPAGVLS